MAVSAPIAAGGLHLRQIRRRAPPPCSAPRAPPPRAPPPPQAPPPRLLLPAHLRLRTPPRLLLPSRCRCSSSLQAAAASGSTSAQRRRGSFPHLLLRQPRRPAGRASPPLRPLVRRPHLLRRPRRPDGHGEGEGKGQAGARSAGRRRKATACEWDGRVRLIFLERAHPESKGYIP
ncbi:hypothetical protein BS78_02G264700 [Paspalum vaginatum]|nr:hypothetical protein BS78_02G264700 [Paspalum vaginatum]